MLQVTASKRSWLSMPCETEIDGDVVCHEYGSEIVVVYCRYWLSVGL